MNTNEKYVSPIVRRPTDEEANLLAAYFAHAASHSPTAEEVEDYRTLIDDIYVAVFPDYVTDSSGWVGSVIVVQYAIEPGDVEVFTLDRGVLTKVATADWRANGERPIRQRIHDEK